MNAQQTIRFFRFLPRRAVRKFRDFIFAVRHGAESLPAEDFDRRTGLDTSKAGPVYRLDAINGNYIHSMGYEPIAEDAFRRVMSLVPVSDFAQFTFVDLGCGKGKALFLACEQGFQKATGVELSPGLARVAAQNAERWSQGNVSIHCEDAASWDWPRGPLVVFLYNPFDGKMMRAVMNHLHSSLRANPRECFVVYYSPAYEKVLLSMSWLRPEISTDNVRIYKVNL